jgi:AcrR family transcriptional regulator
VSQARAFQAEQANLLPPRADAEGTHRRVLEAALECFGERGFHGVTVREIAKRAGIHVSSIYGHIPSKEALLFELSLLGHDEHSDQVTRALDGAGPDLVARFTAYVRAHVHVHISYRMVARVSNKELHCLTGERRDQIQAIRDRSRKLLEDVVDEGRRTGVFDIDDTWLSTTIVLGLGHRACEWWTPELGYPTDQVEEALVEAALRMVGANP